MQRLATVVLLTKAIEYIETCVGLMGTGELLELTPDSPLPKTITCLMYINSQIIYNFKNNRCLCALNFTSELPEAQRKDPIVYEYSVAHWDNIDCGHLLSISEAQLGESVFKSSPGTGFLDWEFLFLQALSLKCQDIDLPLTIRLLAHYSTLHKSKT